MFFSSSARRLSLSWSEEGSLSMEPSGLCTWPYMQRVQKKKTIAPDGNSDRCVSFTHDSITTIRVILMPANRRASYVHADPCQYRSDYPSCPVNQICVQPGAPNRSSLCRGKSLPHVSWAPRTISHVQNLEIGAKLLAEHTFHPILQVHFILHNAPHLSNFF